MSVTEMSETLRKKVLTQLESAIRGKNQQLTQRVLNNHIEFQSRETIRNDTNASAESIFSRGGLDNLKLDMQSYLSVNSSAILTEQLISTLDYDDFKNFLLAKYYTGKVETSTRKEEDFEYSNPIRLSGSSKATKLIIATNTGGDSSRDVLILKNIAYDKIVAYFKEYILSKTQGLSPKELKEVTALMTKMFNAGHLQGVFTGRLIRAFNLSFDKSTQKVAISGSNDPELQNLMQTVINLVTAADTLSSNIFNDVGLFARSHKQLTKNKARLLFTTEVQISSSNIEAGNLLTQAGAELTKLLKQLDPNISQKGREQAIALYTNKLFQKLKPVRDYISKRQAQLKQSTKISKSLQKELEAIQENISVFDALIQQQGSDQMLVHAEKTILNALGGIILPTTSTQTAKVIKNIKPVKQAQTLKTTQLKKTTKKLTINSTQKPTPIFQAAPNLTNLQNLLNQRLHDQIKANMGTGSARGVLNYRSGRFAQSAKVERLQESRQGMITAFYTYMKYPYATFSDGGMQQDPKSRDPKLLIARSIREIAGTSVANRMRAVNV